MTASTEVRRIADELPSSGRWRIDPGHAEVAFTGRHLMLTKVRGRFRGVDGVIVVAEDPDASRVEVIIDVASLDSGDTTRDEHLRSADLFDVAVHPTAVFRSTSVTVSGTAATVEGDLTIKGVTRPVTLDAAYLGAVTDPWGGVHAVFSAHTRINREDWGLAWNMKLDNGGLLVSREIDIDIEIEAIPDTSNQAA